MREPSATHPTGLVVQGYGRSVRGANTPRYTPAHPWTHPCHWNASTTRSRPAGTWTHRRVLVTTIVHWTRWGCRNIVRGGCSGEEATRGCNRVLPPRSTPTGALPVIRKLRIYYRPDIVQRPASEKGRIGKGGLRSNSDPVRPLVLSAHAPSPLRLSGEPRTAKSYFGFYGSRELPRCRRRTVPATLPHRQEWSGVRQRSR